MTGSKLENMKIDEPKATDEFEDELDLLEATIDPRDVKSLRRQAELRREIENEKLSMKVKFLYRYGLREDDPFKLNS